MKIKPEHYEHIKNAIDSLDREKIATHSKNVRESGKFKDFEKRMRWDLSYACGLTQFFCDNIYSYAHDDHIDTALKTAVSELGIAFN